MTLRQAKPTGARRHRVSWNGKLVLQIQCEGFITEYLGGNIDTKYATAWRDATVADITIDEAHAAGVTHQEFMGPFI